MARNDISLRVATAHDLDDIVRIVKTGFPDDPVWDYRFPYRNKYPEDHDYWTRKEYADYLSQVDKFAIVLAMLPKREKEKENNVTIAVAVWDLNVMKDAIWDIGVGKRRDANTAHVLACSQTLVAAAKRYFGARREKQHHLWALVTHPDYRRRGAGSALVRWGTEAADKKGWAASVVASSLGGKAVYEYCGFDVLGEVIVQIEGEEERAVEWCMEWVHDKKMDKEKYCEALVKVGEIEVGEDDVSERQGCCDIM